MMSFPFRRREANQFKHIAHGLIPAATVAPRSAVPRTPPPRSPNPSPERPRSALAAAILMTSLTGRTVAMPQPRQRSYSENDSTYFEETEVIEPYATARELGFEQNWKEYALGKNRSSPVRSLSFEDEDTEEQMSEIEDNIFHISQEKDEKVLSAPIYATPCKNKKEKLQPPDTMADDVHEISDNNQEDLSEVVSPELEEEFKADVPLESPIPSPDREPNITSPRRKRTELMKTDIREAETQVLSAALTKETEKLQARNQFLTNANQELSKQMHELKQQIKAMKLKIKNLRNEKREAVELWKKQYTEADAAELVSLREQAQELVDENDALKMTVHRLNVELSRYQTKYRPLSKEEKVKIGGLPQKGPPPPWLLDMKYLSPLLLAYEDRMNEKDNIILSFQEEINNFKARVKEVLEENEQLHKQLENKSHISTKEWQLIQSQAQLVLEENEVLMKQLEVQQSKAKDIQNRHIQEVSRITKQLMVLEAKNKSQEEELLESKKQQEALYFKCDELKANTAGKISVDDHLAMMDELKSQLQQERDKRKVDSDDLMNKIATVQAEKKSHLLEKNDLIADNKTLEAEMEIAKKSNRKLQKRIDQLKHQLEDAMDKEVAAHQYLANILTLAESIAGERDELIYVAKGLEAEKLNNLKGMMEGSVRLGRLEEMVKVYKKKSAGKVEDISLRLAEQEEDFAGKAARHQREMKHLQRLLQDKQETLDEVLQQKRQVENELEVIWKSASHENKQLKDFLHKVLKQNKWNVSSASQNVKADSVNEYRFSYCDVISSSEAEDPVK
ncbi:centrosomal protein of 89 kDa [Bombina bombina]|uniref:centrosomal protein of 89 kDa n=1 Tax=Bombina bombina TaxID=8345 RepID=UPI00235AFFF5|nr:centrosomal protein of 89 kDa [Bombina bombina]